VEAYVVGGAVRDELLGLPVADRDWVVVGATPEEMVALGYRPVGRDFPVFLHPQTHEEYALARTERKSGRGYKGFTVYASPEVTLEQDLARRDFTINAIARDAGGRLIDPFHGERDLRAGVLRHVSEAFGEDPVRILRGARFAARFGFRIADETMALMRTMVDSGEADHLVPERVWQEFGKGLMEPQPGRMFEVLERCDLRAKLLPELREIPAALGGPLAVRFALLCWRLEPDAIEALCARLKTPNEERELALLACRCRGMLHPKRAAEFLALFKAADAFRRPQRFALLLQAAELHAEHIDVATLRAALDAAAAVDAGAVARGASSPGEIPALLDRAREQAIGERLENNANNPERR
jgi:tRNA nucleotidyltransferase (CCA-adding enzyme)